MKLTVALKAYLVANGGCKADAPDEDFHKTAATMLAGGKLSPEDLVRLSADESTKAAGDFAARFDALTKSVETLVATLAGGAKGTKGDDDKGDDTDAKGGTKAALKGTKGVVDAKGGDDDAGVPVWYKAIAKRLDGGLRHTDVEVKGAWDQYSTTKSTMTYPSATKSGRPHPMAGRPVVDFAERGRVMSNPSDLDKAIAGSYAKLMVATAQRGGSRTFGFQSLPAHDRELLYYAMEHYDWGGASDGGDFADIQGRKLTPSEQKALIDDSTSGGLEAAPIVFDDQVIQAPLNNGELFPLVNTIPLDRGRRVEGVSTGVVTGTWGGVDDTSIALFNTASFVSAFDTTIFRWEGAVVVGLDFLSDSPIDFGTHFTSQYGERLLEDLDDVVAAGNGTTQPEGIINKSGATSVSFGGSTTIGNYESLRFGVAKQEHKANLAATAVFCGTETSYMRARAIPVGASDARRLGGMDYSSYQWMERPYKINASLSNAQIFYAILGRYRMYRRRGLTVRTTTEGDTLTRKSEMLISVTARYGGQMERGACVALTSNAPA